MQDDGPARQTGGVSAALHLSGCWQDDTAGAELLQQTQGQCELEREKGGGYLIVV